MFFNSHPHKEDDYEDLEVEEIITFSTHILTRRMTSCKNMIISYCYLFNSHPHKEDDTDGLKPAN